MPNTPDHAYDLRTYIGILRSRKGEIALVAALALTAGLFFSFRQEPIYEGHAKVLVRPVQSLSSSTYQAPQPPNLDTERQIILSQAIADRVRSDMTPPIPVDALLRNTNVQVVGDTEVLDIGYRSASPPTAANVANAFAS